MNITFDLEGVLIEHLEYTLKQLSLDISLINQYRIGNIASLSSDNKKKILDSFSDVETFREANKHSDVLKRIAEKHTVYINSFSCTSDIADYKLDWIKESNAKIDVKNIKMTILGGDTSGSGDKIIRETDVYIEDCLENLIVNKDKFKTGILIDKPYNREIVDCSKIKRVGNIYEAEQLINELTLSES